MKNESKINFPTIIFIFLLISVMPPLSIVSRGVALGLDTNYLIHNTGCIFLYLSAFFVILFAVLRDASKSFLLSGWSAFIIFQFPTFNSLVSITGLNYLSNITNYISSFLIFTLIIMVGYFLIKKAADKEKMKNFLLLLLVIQVIYPVSTIVGYIIMEKLPEQNLKEFKVEPTTALQKENLPDIYYIMPDMYSNHKTFDKIYNYDNSSIYDFLESKNFYNIKRNYSNYNHTYNSMCATLNMNYIEDIVDYSELTKNHDYSPLMKCISNSAVIKNLKSFGYEIINSSKGLEIEGDPIDTAAFTYAYELFNYTPIPFLLEMIVGQKNYFDPYEIYRQEMLGSIDNLMKESERQNTDPKFVFFSPYVYSPSIYN